MGTILPINLGSLLYCRGVEPERVEFKASWNPHPTGSQVLRTICAFANDYHNLNGGYVVIGVGERDGRAALPPSGLSAEEAEAAQKWIRGNCNRLDPSYQPILSPETVAGRLILVVWAPASEVKPHRAPASNAKEPGRYWMRLGSETVDAERRGDLLRGLIQQTPCVPWDDRRARDAQYAKSGEFERAEETLAVFEAHGSESAVPHVANTLIDALLEAGEEGKARKLLRQGRPALFGQDAIDAAILARRIRDSRAAHRYFERAGEAVYADPRALLEFAQTKLKLRLASEAHRQQQRDTNRRFLTEARTLLERVIRLDASPARHAWAWRELARVLHWLRAPIREIEDAWRRAVELLPDEPRFVEERARMRADRR